MESPTFTFVTAETVVAGNKHYQTDRLEVTPPTADGEGAVEINHIERACPNCAAIGELAIELRTESLFCPVCEFRMKFIPETHLVSGVDIEDAPPDCYSE